MKIQLLTRKLLSSLLLNHTPASQEEVANYTNTHTQGTINTQKINTNNNRDDSSFLVRAELQTLNDGHFKP
jgi:hypothetical protein